MELFRKGSNNRNHLHRKKSSISFINSWVAIKFFMNEKFCIRTSSRITFWLKEIPTKLLTLASPFFMKDISTETFVKELFRTCLYKNWLKNNFTPVLKSMFMPLELSYSRWLWETIRGWKAKLTTTKSIWKNWGQIRLYSINRECWKVPR